MRPSAASNCPAPSPRYASRSLSRAAPRPAERRFTVSAMRFPPLAPNRREWGGAWSGRRQGARRVLAPPHRHSGVLSMTQPATISADYTLRPSELAATPRPSRRSPSAGDGLGPARLGKIDDRAAGRGGRWPRVRRRPGAPCSTPVDLRGIPWRDAADRTRWAPPVFLPPTDDTGLWLINLEELPSCVPMVQAALLSARARTQGREYELPEGASLIACGNREGRPRRGPPHADPARLALRPP